MRVLSLFHYNHSSLALFGLFFRRCRPKKLQKQLKKCKWTHMVMVKTKRETLWLEIKIGKFFWIVAVCNLRNSLLIASRASFGMSFSLFGMCLNRPLMRPLVVVQTGMGQWLLPFFLWAFIKQGLQTRVSDPMSDSERPSKKAKFLLDTDLEESTVFLQTLHWWGPDFTAKKKEEKNYYFSFYAFIRLSFF